MNTIIWCKHDMVHQVDFTWTQLIARYYTIIYYSRVISILDSPSAVAGIAGFEVSLWGDVRVLFFWAKVLRSLDKVCLIYRTGSLILYWHFWDES